jgi:hypothetical protein
MSVHSLRWRFNYDAVRDVPDQPGVFTLWDGNEAVLIGTTLGTASLKDALRQCLAMKQADMLDATHLMWEATSTPRTRAGDLLSAHLHNHGELPRYNRTALGLAQRPLQNGRDLSLR